MKVAIVVMSNPTQGEEALGRVFNALALATQAQAQADEVALLFAGTGTRWPEQLSKLDHPAHALYEGVRTTVVGASRGCAVVFGATQGVADAGVSTLHDNPIGGTPGMLSIHGYLREGWHTLVF